ncbi:hypothetical protein Cgig2_005887 [Carnegiea gigantea]|uniref:Uncharacterized protein n=1 Tax=Carnegiea gigantea TaxID=171969 RepID=A0A9Q1QLV7_9CARY|nr:hypothetical protein Cgig2_005887 [Carnegiea gigantea]
MASLAVASTPPTRRSSDGSWVYAPPFVGWGWIFQRAFHISMALEDDGGRRQSKDSFVGGASVKAESTGASHAANAPLRQRRVGVRAFIVIVLLYFLAWFGFGGLEGRRRKKAVSRHLRQRHVLHMRHPSVADLMMLMLQIMDSGTGNCMGLQDSDSFMALIKAPISGKAESTSASHAANAPLRRRCVGVRAFVVMVLLYFPAWIGFGGLEGRRRKKAVSRCLRRRLFES